MTMIVGYAPDGRGRAVLHLAGLLARTGDDDVVVACVVPAPWFPGMARIDAEYADYLDSTADAALEVARAHAPAGVRTSFVKHHARSAPAGLLELAAEHDARLLALGSSTAGAFGHVALGSVTDRLLHSSPVTLALAPRGYRCKPDARVRRATVAFGAEASEGLVAAAATVVSDVGATLRLASFGVWSRPAYTTRLGTDPEDLVLQEWRDNLEATVQAALARLASTRTTPPSVETVIGWGASWGDALDDIEWTDGDVLVVGSSAIGPVARVFLGSRATKILRHSPVPVLAVPRGRAEELAETAET
jgi:nucleotide-binding universal stress UspA family protein